MTPHSEHDQVQRRQELLETLMTTLKAMARNRKRRSSAMTLQTTEIVHETYLRLLKQYALNWNDKDQFLIAFASTMRRFLVDHYRRRTAEKRGGHQVDIRIDDTHIEIPAPDGISDWGILDDKLNELEDIDSVARQIVELRYFAGMTLDETAATVNITARTVSRKWNFARTYLRTQLSD